MASQAIRSFHYDAERNELAVTFTSGRGYVYWLVPPAVAAALAASPKKGVFHNAHIRDHYPFRKVKAETSDRSSLRAALVASAATGGQDAPTPTSAQRAWRNGGSPDRG